MSLGLFHIHSVVEVVMIRKLVGIFLQQVVDKDAEQQCAGNRCDCDLAECQ